MMNADNLALQECPNALNSICMNAKIANILASRVVDCMVIVIGTKAAKRSIFVGHNSCARFHIVAHITLKGAPLRV